MKCHMTLIPISKIKSCIFGPLICFGEQHFVVVVIINMGAQATQEFVCLGQVFAVRSFPLV